MDEVLVPLLVLRQQHQMAVLAVGPALLVGHGLLGHVHLAPQDRRQAVRLGLFVKLHRPVHHAVVGHGDVRHAQLFGALHQLGNARRTVEQAVLRMHV